MQKVGVDAVEMEESRNRQKPADSTQQVKKKVEGDVLSQDIRDEKVAAAATKDKVQVDD